MRVIVEQRDPQARDELAWSAVGTQVLTRKVFDGVVSWEGEVTLPSPVEPGKFRVVIEENERFRTDGRPSGQDPVPTPDSYGRRLTYTDIVAV